MKALFAGSFDPFTIGHLAIVESALKIFSSVVVAIGVNGNKKPEWPASVRRKAIADLFKDDPRVEVTTYSGITFRFARMIGAGVLVRGVRNGADFEFEKTLAEANRKIGGIETVFIPCDPGLAFVSSSLVRELLHNGEDPSSLIAGNFPLPPAAEITDNSPNL